MAAFSIYVLDEQDLTLSAGGLDGVTQGDGSHLIGRTLTIDTPNWTEIFINDDDSNFRDNDSGQRLDGAQTVDGVTYASGTVVEAEYSFDVVNVSDPTQTWKLIAFNVRNSSPAFGTVEGIAVIGGPGDFPPPNITLQVTAAQEGPNFAAADYATPICFDAGTPLETPKGSVLVEDLSVGDLVNTLDNGPQPIRWIGCRRAFGLGRFAPVEIASGSLGNARTLRVSQQHKILLRDPRAEMYFGDAEILAPAVSFVGRPGVRLVQGAQVAYYHLLFDGHEVVCSAGMWSESFFPNKYGLSTLDRNTQAELDLLFPGLATSDADQPSHIGARRFLRRYEAEVLLAS